MGKRTRLIRRYYKRERIGVGSRRALLRQGFLLRPCGYAEQDEGQSRAPFWVVGCWPLNAAIPYLFLRAARLMMIEHLDITFFFWQSVGMRTTLTIDNDLLAAARSLARAQSLTLGQALSELARRGLSATARLSKGRRGAGFPVFTVPRDAHPITLEDVHRAEDEA